MEKYTGYFDIKLNDSQLAQLYNGEKLEYLDLYKPYENQYAIIKNEEDKIIDIYRYQNNEYKQVGYNNIENSYDSKIKPKNDEQRMAIDLLKNHNIGIKLLKGVYGSGKDFLMLNYALECLEKGKFQKIVFIRPNVTVADVPDIGYLKGSVFEKLSWTLGPLYDKVGGEEGVQRLMNMGQLELAPLSFIRGRSFDDSIVYVSEGQNITSEIAKLLISRIGNNSELWINADNHQADSRIYIQDNGINKMIDRLKGQALFGTVYLSKTERGKIANLANLLDN